MHGREHAHIHIHMALASHVCIHIRQIPQETFRIFSEHVYRTVRRLKGCAHRRTKSSRASSRRFCNAKAGGWLVVTSVDLRALLANVVKKSRSWCSCWEASATRSLALTHCSGWCLKCPTEWESRPRRCVAGCTGLRQWVTANPGGRESAKRLCSACSSLAYAAYGRRTEVWRTLQRRFQKGS